MAKVKPVKEKKEFEERIIQVRRVTKVVKGGKNLSFRTLVVIGNKKGKVGVGLGKAREVAEAVRKALEQAKKSLIEVPIVRGTVPHRLTKKFKAIQLFIAPASEGTGVLAGGSVRAVLELAGYTDVLTKLQKSTNPVGAVFATFEALQDMRTGEQITMLRGKPVRSSFLPRLKKASIDGAPTESVEQDVKVSEVVSTKQETITPKVSKVTKE